jgi:hypothetical protein
LFVPQNDDCANTAGNNIKIHEFITKSLPGMDRSPPLKETGDPQRPLVHKWGHKVGIHLLCQPADWHGIAIKNAKMLLIHPSDPLLSLFRQTSQQT